MQVDMVDLGVLEGFDGPSVSLGILRGSKIGKYLLFSSWCHENILMEW